MASTSLGAYLPFAVEIDKPIVAGHLSTSIFEFAAALIVLTMFLFWVESSFQLEGPKILRGQDVVLEKIEIFRICLRVREATGAIGFVIGLGEFFSSL